MEISNSVVLDPSDDPYAKVSWQSVFWGLAAIAINSMCQPAGRACDTPCAIGPLLRASPIICFIDMLSMIFRLIMYGVQKRSFREACILVLTQRHEYNYENVEIALSNLRYNSPLRWFSFLITVTQSVKLFACQGLVWTKVWAAMYFSMYLTVEVHIFISRLYLHVTGPPVVIPTDLEYIPRTKGVRVLPYASSALGTIFCIVFLSRAGVSAFNHKGLPVNTLDCTSIVLLACGSVVLLTSYYSSVAKGDKAEASLAQAVVVIVASGALAYNSSLMQHRIDYLDRRVVTMIIPTLCLLSAWLSLIYTLYVFRPVGLASYAKRQFEMVLAVYFFALNLIAALLYYRFAYDPEGTIKPAWTEQLG